MTKRIGIFLIAGGLLIISWALYAKYDGYLKKKAMIEQFNKAVTSLEQDPPPSDPEDSAGEISSSLPQDDMENVNTTPAGNKDNIIGLISISRIGLTAPVVQGIDEKSLKYAVGHFPETPVPGEQGNCAIAGHRSFTYSKFFNRLNEIEIGDTVVVKTAAGQFRYIVYEKKIVDPDDFSVLDNTKDSIITLVTCHPERSSAFRLIVKGRLE